MAIAKQSPLCKTLLLALFLGTGAQAAEPRVIDVHRDANCGCCKNWIRHLQANGFTVRDHVEPDMSVVKKKLAVPNRLGSCHTGVYRGKFVEGHVPAEQIVKLERQKDLAGIAVPGMPAGSPGMEVPNVSVTYHVVGVDRQGKERVLATYPGKP
ncbi:MAG: hypothetical protein K0S16_422 [Moraxellaceae bacterium]|nr:hypothetical protein [Moraxellaceae bacterium]